MAGQGRTETKKTGGGSHFLSVQEVAAILGISAASVRRLSRAEPEDGPVFPRPISLPGLKQVQRWRRSEIYAWLELDRDGGVAS